MHCKEMMTSLLMVHDDVRDSSTTMEAPSKVVDANRSANGSTSSTDSMASTSSAGASSSTLSNPEDPSQSPTAAGTPESPLPRPSAVVELMARPLFRLSTQTSEEEEFGGESQASYMRRKRNSRDLGDMTPSCQADSQWLQQVARGRSDSWSHRTRSTAATAALAAVRAARFRKSATQSNLNNNNGHASVDDLTQQQVITTRRLFNISNSSSMNSSMELLEQHPMPPAITVLSETVSVVSVAKHVHTEQILSKHSLKTQLTKCHRLLDAYFGLLAAPSLGANIEEKAILENLSSISILMRNAWQTPQIGIDLAQGLCEYIRDNGFLNILLDEYILKPTVSVVALAAAIRALQPTLTAINRAAVVPKLEPLVEVVKTRLVGRSSSSGEEEDAEDCTGDHLTVGVALFEQLFKCDRATTLRLVDLSALDYCLNACKTSRDLEAHRHAAIALANLCMNCDDKEWQQKLMSKNVPDWLYFLASSRDDATRYYACLAICVLVSHKEIEATVTRSGALSLVEPFLRGRNPVEFAFAADYRHQGRPREWLQRFVAMLYSKPREPRMMAAFHLAMDASIKKTQERLDILREVGAVEALRQAAGTPDEVVSDFARRALEVIGEAVPYKLKAQVPLWTVDDVQYWAIQIGFEKYAEAFKENQVDGDLLLLITDEELENDIGMKSGLFRKRFMRELESLKMAADYSCVDGTKLDRFLTSISPRFSIYTYQLLEMGVTDCRDFPALSDEVLKSDCRVVNPVHRLKILEALDDCRHIEDMEVAVLKKQIDVFISYRRSTGSQLASLLKVLLQLRGYKVFIDVDRLYAGQFDSSLFKNIQAADHFVLVLSPQSMDRCMDDEACNDWVHKEISCALRFNKNIIPILDPQFQWPEDLRLPTDIRTIKHFNEVNWVHEYQDACVTKIEKFMKDSSNVRRQSYVPYLDNRRDMG